jgi:putative transposase
VRFALIARIDQENQGRPRADRISIRTACATLEVSPSGYYAWRSRPPSIRKRADQDLTERLEAMHERYKGRYGLRRFDAMLRRQDRRHSRRRLRRLARSAGIACIHPKARAKTTIGGAARTGLVDLVDRVFVPEHPGEVIYGDITYIPTAREGFVYLALFTDGCSRRIVGWEVADHMRTDLVTTALGHALSDLQPEIGQLVVHADRGSQYTSNAFRDKCFDAGAIPSVGRTGSCFDNAAAESVNATIKKELINPRTWTDLAEVRAALFEYIEIDYNRDRIHQGLGYRTPIEFEAQLQLEFTEAA